MPAGYLDTNMYRRHSPLHILSILQSICGLYMVVKTHEQSAFAETSALCHYTKLYTVYNKSAIKLYANAVDRRDIHLASKFDFKLMSILDTF